MNPTNDTEDLLRRTLGDKAGEAAGDLTFAEIRDAAALQKRRLRRRRLGYLAAAAAVVVAAPAGVFTLTHRDASAPPPPAGTTSDSPSPSPTPSGASSPTTAGLDTIPRGPDGRVTYLLDGVVHLSDGSTTRLPAAADDVTQFAPYHGGWIVIDSVGGLTEYAGNGAVVLRSTGGDSALAVSGDQLRTAFQVDGQVLVGISSGMGDGENKHTVPANSSLVGFLGDRVVFNSPDGPRAVDDAGTETAVPGLPAVEATDARGSLVGGLVGTEQKGFRGAVADSTDGSVLWRNGWRPLSFSGDSQYVAAVPVADNGDPSAVAILDAHTGEVVALTPGLGTGISLGWSVAWDGTRVVFDAIGDGGTQEALLALDINGRLSRASDVVTREPGLQSVVLAAQP